MLDIVIGNSEVESGHGQTLLVVHPTPTYLSASPRDFSFNYALVAST